MKSYQILLLFFVLMSFLSCVHLYKIEKDKFGEPILNEKVKYTFNEKLSDENYEKIDTTAYYIQQFPVDFDREDLVKNPRLIIFHNDGFFKNESLLYFGKFDEHRGKNSVYYGGKYRINGNIIQMEQFGQYPGYKKFYKWISEGKIEGDKIIFRENNYTTIFEKRKSINQKNSR